MATRSSRATSAERSAWRGRGWARQVEEREYLRAGRSTARERAPAGRRCWRHSAPLRGSCAIGRVEVGLRIGAHAHLHQPDNVFALSDRHSSLSLEVRFFRFHEQGQPRQAGLAPMFCFLMNLDSGYGHRAGASSDYSSRIKTAAAIVVVQRPRLSPTADCVMLLVRTILLEIR